MILDVLVSDWLDVFISKNTYVSLHYAVPPLNDPNATELTGGTYSRQKATFEVSDSNARMAWNNAKLTWAGLESTTVTHIGVYDGPYSSTLLFYVSLSTAFSVPSNGTFEVPLNELYVRLP